MEVACDIIYNRDGKILLGLRSDNGPNPGYWEFPGGQLEKDETIEECLKREWIEELNLDIEIVNQITSCKSGRYLCRFFVGWIMNEEQIQKNVHTKIGYFTPDEIKNLKLFDEDYAIVSMLSIQSQPKFSAAEIPEK